MHRRILNGWKEIAGYLERSVRTAQRWEARMQMPVHRPAFVDNGVVIAFSDELDSWISRATPSSLEKRMLFPAAKLEELDLLRVLDDMSMLAWDAAELAARMRLLQEQLRRSLRLHRHRRSTRRKVSLRAQGRGRLLNFPAPATDQAAGKRAERARVYEPSGR